jgi:hypothetical protein
LVLIAGGASFVMPGLDPRIHEAGPQREQYDRIFGHLIMDCRVKPGNDTWRGERA